MPEDASMSECEVLEKLSIGQYKVLGDVSGNRYVESGNMSVSHTSMT